LLLGGTEGVELHFPVADAGTEDQLAVAHDIQRAKFLRHMQRAVQRQQYDPWAQAQLRRDQRDLAQIRDLLDVLERMRTIVRPFGDQVVAEVFSPFRGIEVFFQANPHVVALRILATDDQAKAHAVLPLVKRERGRAPAAVKVDLAGSKGHGRWRVRAATRSYFVASDCLGQASAIQDERPRTQPGWVAPPDISARSIQAMSGDSEARTTRTKR
jgi:hypothetical protein